MVGGLSLRFVDYEHDSAGVWVARRITERLGDDYAFWPQPQCGLNEVKRGLRCYTDDEMGLVSADITPACDFTNTIVDRTASPQPRIAPSPGVEGFTFQGPPGSHRAQVFDAGGREVRVLLLSAGCWVDASAWPPGHYILKLKELGAELKWVKE